MFIIRDAPLRPFVISLAQHEASDWYGTSGAVTPSINSDKAVRREKRRLDCEQQAKCSIRSLLTLHALWRY